MFKVGSVVLRMPAVELLVTTQQSIALKQQKPTREL